ncbi:hypothetical protein D7Z54_04040 [Salibacterium salarium]|uniref:ABC-2 type transport system permease protein n=1 Tax=Salibacterium salarium TaxID=284579 RepID=A0A3R9RFL4_9BACI|nr:hypothetical protein [Salibacterium salarium]RSL34341.1 hypothetical protein D7Z54_04040 [Salibacterium salarium]
MRKWINPALFRQEITLFWGHPAAWIWLAVLIGYFIFNVQFYAEYAADYEVGVSGWELLVLTIDSHVTTFGFSTIFFIFVFMAERRDALRSLYVYRLRNRTQWMVTKAVSLFLNALFFTIFCFIVLLVSASLFREFHMGWSTDVVEVVQIMDGGGPPIRPIHFIATSMDALQPYSPEQLVPIAFLFCILGMMIVGLLFHTMLLIVSKPVFALAGMIFYTTGSLLIADGIVNGWYTALFPQLHIIPSKHMGTEQSMLQSLLVCVPVIIVLYLVSWQLLKRKKITV